jgi:diguanylate cyclase (GGDEF)-like protein
MSLTSLDTLAECDLLRGLVFWESPNSEIEAGLAGVAETPEDFRGLALRLTGMVVPEEIAKSLLNSLLVHVKHLSSILNRRVGVRAAALDLLDELERRLREAGVVQVPPHDNLVRMAFVDYLTGLPNFRSLSDTFEKEIKRATRYGRLLSLIVIDLDGFKEINDRFGHQVGNAALKHVASLLRGFVRETDVVGRFGGDEFMVLLPETPKHLAEGVAGGIQVFILSSPLLLGKQGPIPVTVSVGMASFPRDARTADALMAEADAAMYRAKRAGRNQVCFCKPRTSARLSHGPFDANTYDSVHVIGDFNGWDRTAEPMAWEPPKKCFTLELFLAPGKYEYKLLLNQEKLISDPDNPESVHDGFDGRNSILRVGHADIG